MAATQARTEDQKQHIFERRLARRARQVWGRRATNAFIALHIFVVAVWLMPSNTPVGRALLPPDGEGWVRDYMVGSGFEQAWQMFSPNPDTRDLTITAHVTLQNGQTRDWRFPRMRDLGYAAKYQRERMRKFLEIANYHEALWPGMARYAARQCGTQPGNPPVAVSLIRFMRDVPPPGKPQSPLVRQEFFQAAYPPGERP